MIALLGLHRFHALVVELEVVAQAAVEDACAGAAGIRRQQIAVAGHAQHRAGHGIEHASAVRVGDDDPARIDRRNRVDRKILHIAVSQQQPDGLGLLLRGGGGGIGIGDQRAVDDAALAGAGTRAAGKRLQQASGAALGRGRKRVVADLDGPGPLADRNARQRRLILRIQPALRRRGLRRQRDKHSGAQTETEPGGKRNGAFGGHEWIVPGSARGDVHLGRNIRQTTRKLGENHAYQTSHRLQPLAEGQGLFLANPMMSAGIAPFI